MLWRKKDNNKQNYNKQNYQAAESESVDIKDIEKAIEHYKSTPSEITLLHSAGMAYLNGEYNAEINNDKALDYFRRASDLGHAESQYKCGQMYMIKGLKNNDSMTFVLGVTEVYKAYKNGCEPAKEELQDVVDTGFFQNVYSLEDLLNILEENTSM